MKHMLTFVEVAVALLVLAIVFRAASIYRIRGGALANRPSNWNG